jgi:hypothetical protein
MPAYAFEIRWDGGERISWTYLPTDESARKFAQILAQNFKVGDQYRGSARIAVKNNDGALVASIQF